jgi:hypothetical protein
VSLKRWAAATAVGILLVIGMPVSAIANETDECADAGLISSLLWRCGALGGLLGGSDPAPEDPDAVDTTVPDDNGTAGTDFSDGTSGGPSTDTSGNSTGPDDSGGTSGTPTGSSSDPTTSTGSGSPGAPIAGTASTSDATSGFTGTRPVGPSSGTATGGAAGRAQSAGSVVPSQVVGPLSELPDAPQVAGPAEGFPEAAGMPRVAESTGPVVGVALTLITAGIFVAITGWWMAIWRNTGRSGA